ncbi:MAG: DMT family transporter [Bacillota bacterium]|nr:DMT family transporter [Bacillota bacterium]
MLHDEKEEGYLTQEEKARKDRRQGYAAAIFFSVLVGFSFLGIKVCQPYADSLEILCYRYDFAFISILLLIAFGFVKIDLRGKPKKKLLLTAGFYVGFMALQVTGLVFATSVEGAIFFAIIPILVKIIASIFLGETSSWKENAFVCLTVAALIVMIVMGATDIHMKPLGVVLLLLSSLAMAISNVFMRSARNVCKPIEITFTIIMLGFLPFNIAAVIKGYMAGETIMDYFEPLTNIKVLIAGAYLGIGCILLSAHLMSYMLSKMEAVKATIFGNVSTAISIVAGVVILGEPLRWYHIVCTVLIVTGVVGLSLSGNKTAPLPADPGKDENPENPEKGR